MRLPVLLLLALASCAKSADTDDREQLIARIDQFDSAIREGDKQKYGDVFVEDFVFTWSRDGQIYNREMILPNVVPTPAFDPMVDELIVRIYGDSAVVNYRVRKKADDVGKRVTFSYARIEGEWKVMASHSTAIVVAPDD